MSLDLILKDIDDAYVRENFFRISRFINDQTILGGNWRLYKIELATAVTLFKFKHNLNFIPKHIILLSVEGNKKIDFRYDLFTRDHIVVSSEGAACLTILAGNYEGVCDLKNLAQVPIYDPPTIIVYPSATSILGTYTTDAATLVGHLCKVTGVNTITKITSNASAVIPHGIFGIVYAKPTATTADVIFLGPIGGYVGFTVGSALFVSTTGTLTHTVPATGMVQQIGFATDVDTIHINLKQPMRRA